MYLFIFNQFSDVQKISSIIEILLSQHAELETLELNLRQSNIVALSRISSSASKSNNHYLILLWVGRAYVCILLFCQKMRRQRSIISFARVLHLWFPMYCKTYRIYSFEFKLLLVSFSVLKSYKPLQSCCCPVQNNRPGKTELAWQVKRHL